MRNTAITEDVIKGLKKKGYLMYEPTTTSTTSEDNGKKSATTLVLMLPWMGSNERLARHYVQLYTDMGFYVLSYTASGWQIGSAYMTRRYVIPLLDTILHYKLHVHFHDILVHAMSNNGGALWSGMLAAFKHNPTKYAATINAKIRGCIHEAFPGFQREFRAINALSGFDYSLVGGSSKPVYAGVSPLPLKAMIYLYAWFVWIIFAIRHVLRQCFKTPFDKGSPYLNHMMSEQVNYPQLILYSEGDYLVPAEQTEEFWNDAKDSIAKNKHKQALASVEFVKFGVAANHMRSLVTFPAEYKNAVNGFVQRVLHTQ